MSDVTLLRMQQQIDAWKEADDQRYLFLACYARMTGNMLAAIPGKNFHDTLWVDTLLH